MPNRNAELAPSALRARQAHSLATDLSAALAALRSLEKKVRRLRDRGIARSIDVVYCTYAKDLLHGIAQRHKISVDGQAAGREPVQRKARSKVVPANRKNRKSSISGRKQQAGVEVN